MIIGEFISVGMLGCFVNCGSVTVEWGNVVVCGSFVCWIVDACIWV